MDDVQESWEEKTYLIHNLNSTSQPFIFTQILLMPSIQLPNHRSHPTLLPSGCKHNPSSRYFFVGSTPTADAGDRNIIDELARMFKETCTTNEMSTRSERYIKNLQCRCFSTSLCLSIDQIHSNGMNCLNLGGRIRLCGNKIIR